MKKILLLCSLVSVFAFSCTNDKGEVPVPLAECVADTVIHVVPVVIADNTFSPLNLTIIAGDTVSWVYTTGSSVHTTTCDGTSGSVLASGGTTWDSGIMNPGNSFKKAIAVAGNYTYICTIHGAAMSGTIVVKPRCQ